MTTPNTQHPNPYLLVHGAFRGGWSWYKVRDLLRNKGHEAFAPDLTGAGTKSALNSHEITLSTWVKDITDVVEATGIDDVIMVGHSQGGIIIQAVAEEIPDRISKLVFIDAPVLKNGECALDSFPHHVKKVRGETPRDVLINPIPLKESDELSAEDVEWINERLTAVPTNPSFQKLTISKSARIPHRYFFCSKTPPVYPASFTRKRFDREGIEYELIDAGHDVIMSKPQLIADILTKV